MADARGAVFERTTSSSRRGDSTTFASVHAGVVALAEAGTDAAHISVLAVFDHEEVGVGDALGCGRAVPRGRHRADPAGTRCGSRAAALRALAASWCVSSDVGHSVHPNYVEKHDPVVQPLLGSGPILKINANQRYATDAGAAAWHGCATPPVAVESGVRVEQCGALRVHDRPDHGDPDRDPDG